MLLSTLNMEEHIVPLGSGQVLSPGKVQNYIQTHGVAKQKLQRYH